MRAGSVRKNEIHEMKINGYTSTGDGIGRIDGLAVFVPYTIAGERVLVKILKVKKTYAYGKLIEVIEPSPERIEPVCSVFGKCGGCMLQHMSYEEELRFKLQKVSDVFSRIGGLDFTITEIIGAQEQYGYRNKVSIPVRQDKDGHLTCGFYARNSHRVVEYDTCYISDPILEKIAQSIITYLKKNKFEAYNEQCGHIRHLYLRKSSLDEIMVCIVVNEKKELSSLTDHIKSLDSRIVSIAENVNTLQNNVILGREMNILWGKETITERIFDLKIELSPQSFLQINHSQMEKLYQLALAFSQVTEQDTVLDLFCGTGTISLCFAQKAKKVYGVEIVEEAVKNAKRNAELNQIENASFFAGDTEKVIEKFKDKKIDIVVLDPPRQGSSRETIEVITQFIKPERVVYVSCDPGTLARDLRLFSEQGYQMSSGACVDMFPETGHVETVCQLVLRRSPVHINIDVNVEELVQDKRGQATYEQIKE